MAAPRPKPPSGHGPPSSRREFRRVVTSRPVAGPAGKPRAPRTAMVFFYALIFLTLTVLVGVIGGIVVLPHDLPVGVVLLFFGVAAAAAIWLLRQRSVVGYWLAVAVLFCAGAAAMSAAAVAGNLVLAVVLCPPLAVAIVMARPSIRVAITRGEWVSPGRAH